MMLITNKKHTLFKTWIDVWQSWRGVWINDTLSHSTLELETSTCTCIMKIVVPTVNYHVQCFYTKFI